MGAADLEVRRIVPRRYLQRAGAELRFDALVGNHRYTSLGERHDHLFADYIAIALVIGMHGDGDVRQDGRRPYGGDRHRPGAVRERIADVGEPVVDVLVLDLEIRKRRLIARTPVHDPVVAIDPSLVVQMHEPPDHRAVVTGIHREALTAIVERRAEAPELLHDRPAVALEPPRDVFVESFAAEIALRLSFFRELATDGRPRRDARVVVARLEQRVEAAHPVVTAERILERELQRVPERQRAGNIRRRMHDDERLARRIGIGRVETFLLPGALPAFFDAVRFVQRVHQASLAPSLRGLRRPVKVTQELCAGV